MWHRKPAVAGAFYPDNPEELKKVITTYLNKAGEQKINGNIYGVISPHAGYVYSGPIAAYAFQAIKNKDIEVAFVLAPSHRARFQGASVIPGGIYETPLGNVPIDEKIGQQLSEYNTFEFIQEVHQVEHSLEVQVPFLQMVLKAFSIVPIIIGSVSIDTCKKIAQDIYAVMQNETRKCAIIISTDLSHYHSYNSAVTIDERFIESVKSFDEKKVSEVCSSGKAEACGEGPVLTGIMLSKMLGAKRMEVLKYANSGDTAGSKDQVVGYFSAAFID